MSKDKSLLSSVIKRNLPLADVSLIFGYGSRVVEQEGDVDVTSLFDIIIVVNDSHSWHKENLNRNGRHYSLLRCLPSSLDKINYIQHLGAGVYFNPYVEMEGLSIKYGVIQTNHLIEDLNNWSTLYVAGRLHKPVDFILDTRDKNEPLRLALRFNKESAIRAALLQLPETFDTTKLYQTITGLSYNGDLRMFIGEDKRKVENIVSKQIELFDRLYSPTIKLNKHFKDSVHFNESKQVFVQDLSPKTLMNNLRLLPSNVRRNIVRCNIHGKEARTVEADVVLASASRSLECDKIVSKSIASIVLRSSSTQSLKGLITAGLMKSLKYSQRKLFKTWALK